MMAALSFKEGYMNITTDDNNGDEVEWTWGQKPDDAE
jgi:hypothetical protein